MPPQTALSPWRPLLGHILVVAFVAVLSAFFVQQSRQRYEEQAVITADNLTQLLGRQVGGAIEKIDLALHSAALEAERQEAHGGINREEMNRFLARQMAFLPVINGLGLTDARGLFTFGTDLPPGPAIDISDRDYFQRFRLDPGAGLLISGPYVGRSSRQWVLIFARRLNRPDGSFAGTVSAGVRVERFQEMLSSVNLGPRGVAMLRTRDMQLVARFSPISKDKITGDRTITAGLRTALQADPDRGSVRGLSPVDQVERQMAYRQLAGLPLYVMVGLATEDYLAPWWKELYLLLGVVASFSLVTLGLARSAWKSAREREATSRLLQEAVQSTAVGFSIFDPDDRLVICNELSRDFFGDYGAILKPGARFADILRSALPRTPVADAQHEGEQWLLERLRRHREADGKPFEMKLNDGRQLLVVEHRTPSGHTVVNRIDITELTQYRLHLEHLVESRTADLKAALDQFRILVELSPTAIAMVDRNLNYLATSQRWRESYGQGRSHLIGQQLYEVSPDLPESWRAAHRAALAGAMDSRDEDLWIHADGRRQWLRWAVHPWIDASGQIGGIILASEDITDRKRAEAQLRESEAHLRQLSELLPQLIWTCEPGGMADYLSPQWADYSGRPVAELMGMGWLELIHPADVPATRRAMVAAIKENLNYDVEFRILGRDDSYRWFRSRGIPLRDGRGAVTKWFGTCTDIEELKETQAQLRLTGERLETALKTSAVIAFNQDRDLRYTWIYHPQGAYPLSEIQGKRDPEIFERADDATATEAIKREVLATGLSQRREILVRDRGVDRYFDLIVDPLRDADGEIVGVGCAALDITERKASELAVRRGAERLQLALSAANMRVFEYDPVADRVRREGHFGLDLGLPAEFPGSDYLACIHPEDLPGLQAAVGAMTPDRPAYTHEYRFRMPDGTWRWLSDHARGQFDAQGRLIRVLGVCWDINERKTNEQRLKGHAERQALLLDIASSLLQFRHDRTGLAERIFEAVGRHLDADVGLNFRLDRRDGSLDLVACYGIPPEHVQDLKRLTLGQGVSGAVAVAGQAQALDAGQIESAEMAALVRSLGIRAYACHPLLANDGSVLGTLSLGSRSRAAFSADEAGFLQTLAYFMAMAWERQQAENEIQRLNADLERRVAARTAELEASNRELQGFTYAASHDMKGPLGRINSFSTLLERNYRERLEGDGLLFLDFIRGNARRLAILIDDLLAHAQMDQAMVSLEALVLEDVVRQTLEEKADDIRDRGARVRLDFPAGPVQVLASRHGLAQALRNLVGNALKYAVPGTAPDIEIGARRTADRCCLWVRDRGIGFDMVYHDRIFEIFRRLHTYEEIPGSGVGLALVKKAMDRMGGRVWAESAPGQGTTFYLELAAA